MFLILRLVKNSELLHLAAFFLFFLNVPVILCCSVNSCKTLSESVV